MEESEVLALAKESPHGLAVTVSDFGLARQRLYAARRRFAPAFDALEIHQAPDGSGDLWITHAAPAPKAPQEALKDIPPPENLGL